MRLVLVYVAVVFGLMVVAMAAVPAQEAERGFASYYAHRHHGRFTANGERFDMRDMTAAHRRLPFNSLVTVTTVRGGRQVVVRINDRGPFVRGRVIDLSLGAARALGIEHQGLAEVWLSVPTRGDR